MSQNKTEIVADPVEPIVTARRVVNAPRALVWDCFTVPEHVVRWKTPKGVEVGSVELDLRVGGKWRVIYRRPDGGEFGFHGEYRVVVVPERFVRTFAMIGAPGESIETIVLSEAGPGKTLITTKTEYESVELRNRVMPGVELGLAGAHVQLDELLASLLSQGGASAQATS
jgi:uncharacterized protein YndB with AHSA1/START domain